MKSIILALLLSAVATNAQQQIKFATQAPKGSSLHQEFLRLDSDWRKATGGRVTLTVYPDGSQGDEADVVRRMRVGQLQGALLTVTGLQLVDESVTSLQVMPMVFRDLDEVAYIRQKLTPRISQQLYNKGFVVLGWGDGGWVRFFSCEDLEHPDDLRRMKIFTWAGDNRQAELMRSQGLQPVVLQLGDVLPMLQTRQINAVPTIPYHALTGQIYGTAKHMLAINWVPLIGALVVTRSAWEALPASERQQMEASAREAMDRLTQRARGENDAAVAAMRARGLIVRDATPAINAEWRRSAEEIYPKIRGSLVPADMFDEVQRLIRERRGKEAGSK